MVATMRAVETAKIGLYVSFVTLIVNVICNYILIFGKLGFPALGVTGAAVATLFSRIIEAAVMVVYVRCIDKKLKLRFADLLKRGGELTRDFLRYGLPIMGGQVVWSVNMLGQTMILGRYDAGVIAAVSIANMLHNMMYIAMNGLSSAVGIYHRQDGRLRTYGQNSRVFPHDAGHFPWPRHSFRHCGALPARPVHRAVRRERCGRGVCA